MITFKNTIYNQGLSFSLLTILLLLLHGCAQENPVLYDPSLRDSSVSIRFINMTSDPFSRSFTIDGCSEFKNISFGNSSDLRVNTIDSAHYSVMKNGNILYSTVALQRNKLSFFRNTIQTFIACGTASGDSTYVLQLSSFRTDIVKGKAKVRVINVLPDSDAISVYLGCESGQTLASSLHRGQLSSDNDILPGSNALTLIQSTNNLILGIYDKQNFTFSADSIYTIIIGKDPSTKLPRVFVLNELSGSIQSFSEFTNAGLLQASITVSNVSTIPIKASILTQKTVIPFSSGINPTTSQTLTIETCSSSYADTILIQDINGNVLARRSVQLSPYRSYTVLFASNNVGPGFTISYVENLRFSPNSGKSNLRVINLAYDYPIALNSAARSIGTMFESGRILLSKIFYDDISQIFELSPGDIPILIQTHNTPQRLLDQVIGTLESDKNYLLILIGQSVFGIEESSGKIMTFSKGALLQIIHASSKEITHEITLGSILNKAILQSDGIITTVIPLQSSTKFQTRSNVISVTANDALKRHCFAIDKEERILDYSYSKNLLDPKLTKLRVINLSPVNIIDLYLDYDIRLFNDTLQRDKNRDVNSLIRNVRYQESSEYISIDQERRLSFSLLTWQNPPIVHAYLNNVLISLGKNYGIYLVPESDGKNRTIIRQEY